MWTEDGLRHNIMSVTWHNFFVGTKGISPRPLLVKALSFVHRRDMALDFGAGALNDSMYLLSEGFRKVTAVDRLSVGAETIDKLPADRFEYVISTFEDFKFPQDAYDLVNAQYSLPFIYPEAFDDVLKGIISSLKPGGIFAGQLFGDRDEWNGHKRMLFHTRREAEKLLSDLTVLQFVEEEQDRLVAGGKTKHAHIFHFIVRK